MEEDILRELLDDQFPFFLVPKSDASSAQLEKVSSRETVINKLISKVYSGPTLGDIESALGSTTTTPTFKRRGLDAHGPTKDQNTTSLLNSISLPDKGYSNKLENKYTLRIKSSGNGMTDDGYKWRKYGQKSIKNSPNPRSYYRCTNPRCNAKRQVERSLEDPDVLVVTYEGLHLHYAYPQFFLSRLPQLPQKTIPPLAGPSKKLKTQRFEDPPPVERFSNTFSSVKNWIQEDAQGEEEEEEIKPAVVPRTEETRSGGNHQQGLLEDIVPKLVRNPAFFDDLNPAATCTPSSPPSSSSSSCLSWSPLSSFFDASMLFANI